MVSPFAWPQVSSEQATGATRCARMWCLTRLSPELAGVWDGMECSRMRGVWGLDPESRF